MRIMNSTATGYRSERVVKRRSRYILAAHCHLRCKRLLQWRTPQPRHRNVQKNEAEKTRVGPTVGTNVERYQ